MQSKPAIFVLGALFAFASAACGGSDDADAGASSGGAAGTGNAGSTGGGGNPGGTGGQTGGTGGSVATGGSAGQGGSAGGPTGDPCEVVSIEKVPDVGNLYVMPDGKSFVQNKRDSAGIYQVHVGDVATQKSQCISCTQAPGGPPAGAHKLMINWTPTADWIFVGGEIPHEIPWYISKEQDLGLLQCGCNLDMYATKKDGSVWYKLTNFAGSGYTGPAMTPDGKHAYYAQIIDGNIFAYTFGKWLLKRSDFVVDANGVPSLQNTVDVTPPDTNWIEPGNVSPDGKYLLLTSDTGLEPNKAGGMDQWLMDLETGALTNLNNSPTVWDEHGLFAPNSKKIVFMSSIPYPSYDATTAPFGIWGFWSEFMLMDIDGKNLKQVTHFNQPGYPESTDEDSVAAVAVFSEDGSELVAAQLLTGASFPNQVTWRIKFAGRCGGDGGF